SPCPPAWPSRCSPCGRHCTHSEADHMPDTEAATVIWIPEGTWQANVDAALRFVQPGAPITLLHVTPAELSDTAHGAYLGLLGPPRPDRAPGPHVPKLAAQSAAGLLDAAAARLGRPAGRIERS